MTTPYIISTPPPAVGYVACFIGGGTTTDGTNSGDPNGWVICDGQTRTVTDGRYAALAPLLNAYLSPAVANTANIIKPPDFRNRFLKGQASGTNTTISLGGTGSVKLIPSQIPALPKERFTVTDPGHSHDINCNDNSDKSNTANKMQASTATAVSPPPNGVTATTNNNSFLDASYTNTPTEFINNMPPYFTINYIIKY
jgi:microcystin-dependent protein